MPQPPEKALEKAPEKAAPDKAADKGAGKGKGAAASGGSNAPVAARPNVSSEEGSWASTTEPAPPKAKR
jgi:hypothetical protein